MRSCDEQLILDMMVKMDRIKERTRPLDNVKCVTHGPFSSL